MQITLDHVSHTHQPVSRMRMELILTDAPSFTMIPAVRHLIRFCEG